MANSSALELPPAATVADVAAALATAPARSTRAAASRKHGTSAVAQRLLSVLRMDQTPVGPFGAVAIAHRARRRYLGETAPWGFPSRAHAPRH